MDWKYGEGGGGGGGGAVSLPEIAFFRKKKDSNRIRNLCFPHNQNNPCWYRRKETPAQFKF